MKRLCLLLICLLGLAAAAMAKEAVPMAEDPVAEKRLIAISEEMRCLVCQNESLAGSQADLAKDLRREIREQIKQGKSDQEVMDFMVGRYGDFVRYRPPLKGTTLLLWFGPLLLFIAGVATLVLYLRRRNRRVLDAELSAEEQRKLDALLKEAKPGKAGSPHKDGQAS